jgi:hypothetical protein
MNRGPDVLSKKINLISSDRVVFEVDCGMALMSKRFEDIIATIPVGDVDTISVHEVSSKMLTMVIEYCEKHNNRQKDINMLISVTWMLNLFRLTLKLCLIFKHL